MSVQFNQIPGNLRVPFFWAEINPGQAPYQSNSRLLLFGQMTALGTATPNVPIQVTGSQAGLFGADSMLAAMYQVARDNAAFQEIWAMPLSDAGGATAATGSIALAAQAPIAAPDSVNLYVGGLRISTPVSTSMENIDIANAIAAAVNGCPNMQATAAVTAGAAAHATVTYTLGPVGSAGVMPVVITTPNGAHAYSVPVGASDSNSVIATNVAAAIPASSGVTATALSGAVTFTAVSNGVWGNSVFVSTNPTVIGTPVSTPLASGTNDVVTLTANNGGTIGNGIRIETRHNPGDGWLADTQLVISQFSGGAGDPSITNAIAALGDDLWDFIAFPYCQTTQLNQIEAWLQNRWSPNSMTYGLNFTALVGNTAGAATTFGLSRNSPYTFVMPMYNSPQPASILAAAFAAQAAVNLQSPPDLSLPLQTLVLQDILPPKAIGDRWTVPQRQSFYFSGIGGYTVSPAGEVMLDRVVSTYTKDAYGNPDQAWLDVNTLAQLMYGVRFLRAFISQTYPRAALCNSNPNGLKNFVTVQDIHNALVHAYTQLVSLGVFDDAATFAQLLEVERNKQDPNRIDTYIPVEGVNQLRIFASNVTSYLQYPTA